MFSAFASFLSNFVLRNDSPLEMKDVENIFDNAIQISTPECIEPEKECWNEEGCFYKTGVITAIRDDYVLLDNKYICDLDKVAVKVKVGDKVNYLSYQLDRNKEQKIRKIMSLCDTMWEDKDHQESKSKAEPIIKGQMMDKTIVAKVMRREGRIVFVEPHDVNFNLDNVRSDFIPLVGDWVSLNALVELREDAADLNGQVLEVESVRPLRSKLQTGNVTAYNLNTGVGIIDRNTIFTKAVCEPGYIPCVGDKIVTDSIESDQGVCIWRSLTVVPLNQGQKKNLVKAEPARAEVDELLKEKEMGLIITENLEFNLEFQEERDLTIRIKNKGDNRQTLNKTYFLSRKAESQLTLLSPTVETQSVLLPGDEIAYTFKCKAKFMGLSKEKFLFMFKGFKVVRTFRLLVKAKQTFSERNFTNNVNKNVPARQDLYEDNGYIQGIRPCKPPAFIAVRSGIFKIPQRYWDLVLEAVNNRNTQTERQFLVGEGIPCLMQSLTMQNYRDRFHALLYLEEMGQILFMQKYDMDSVSFSHCGEYLSLTVPGLAEKRPSLIIGDKAIVSFKWDSSKGNLKYEGFVHKVKSTDVLLKFNPKFHNDYSGEDCQVSFKGSSTTLRRCHDAVNLAITHLGPEFLFANKVVQKPPQFHLTEIEEKDYCLSNRKRNGSVSSNGTNASNLDLSVEGVKSPPRVSVLERLFNKKPISSPSERNDEFIVTKVMPYNGNGEINKANNNINKSLEHYEAELKKRKLIWYNKRLNYYQKEAVLNILKGLARPLPYVIFGPPGTGKTITLCEAVLQILTTISDSRLLIATPSNSSANLITERLLDSGVLKPGDLVRLVAQHCLEEGKIPERLLPYCATGQLQEERSGNSMRTEETGFKTNCTASVLGRHRITIGTCSAVGIIYNMGLARGHFTHVLVDEAGQATEPEIMIPLTFIHADTGQVILAGDPMQLGPVVQSNLAAHFGLGESFLSRLLQQFPYQRDPEGFKTGFDPRLVTKLLMNYRSLPEILHLPNSLFYDSELIPQISSTRSDETKLLDTLAPDLPERTGNPPSIVFHGVNGNNYQPPDSPSWYNPEEATQVYFYLLKLYSRGVAAKDIGIITPYQSQVHQIRDLLMELEIEIPKVGSVEEFQGQERSVIILSTVRSTTDYVVEDVKYALGFVAAPRRLNVAITRARALLIIIGNPYLLSEDPYWRTVLTYCTERDAYTGCSISDAFKEQITGLCEQLEQTDYSRY